MTSQALNRPVDVIGVLDAAGANPYAEEGSPAWELARLGAAVADLVEKAGTVIERLSPIERDLIFSKRLALQQLRAARAAIEVRP